MARPRSHRDRPRGAEPTGRATPSHRQRHRPAHRRATRRRRPGRPRPTGVGRRGPTHRGRRTPPGRSHREPGDAPRPDRHSDTGLGGPINADIARRIACDAQVIPVVLGSRGEPLDVGRASYTVPTAIRRAVIVRDRGCAFPGCSIPARWCEIHHVVHWADNGPTSVGNCVALCGRHHKLLHHSLWRIDMTSGIPEFHPPPWLGGPPRRNPLHLIPDLVRIRQ